MLWWLQILSRWDRVPPFGAASSSSESGSWYIAKRLAISKNREREMSRMLNMAEKEGEGLGDFVQVIWFEYYTVLSR